MCKFFGELPETMRNLCLFIIFPYQEIRWNYNIFSVITKHTLKMLLCEHHKIFEVYLTFFNIMHERVKQFIDKSLEDFLKNNAFENSKEISGNCSSRYCVKNTIILLEKDSIMDFSLKMFLINKFVSFKMFINDWFL